MDCSRLSVGFMTAENSSRRMLKAEKVKMAHNLVINVLSSCLDHVKTDEM